MCGQWIKIKQHTFGANIKLFNFGKIWKGKKAQINKKFVNNYKYTHKILIIKYKILIKYFLGWEIFKIFRGQWIEIF